MKRAALSLALFAATVVALPSQATAQQAATPDPARLAEARRTIDHVFPAGTYRRIMGGNFSRMMHGMSDQMLNMPVKDLVIMGGGAPEDVAKMSDATTRQVMAIVDPAFEQRNRLMFDDMMAGIAEIMNGLEPEIRDALVDAYAAKFTTAQLGELNRFFATPTGRLYAESSMTIAMDPAFTSKMMKLTPRIIEEMPRVAKKSLEKTKGLPPRKSWASLDQADKDRLSTLLGLSPDGAEKAVDAIEQQQKKREDAN